VVNHYQEIVTATEVTCRAGDIDSVKSIRLMDKIHRTRRTI